MKRLTSRQQHNFFELSALVLQIIVIAFAFYEEETECWHSCLADNGLIIGETFSAVILQIMATMGTLTIAIVAIMTSVVNERHAGVSVCDYILNIQPRVFNQKRIIILSVAIVIFGMFFHIEGRYAAVLALCLCEASLIILSACSIYVIFCGKKKYIKTIEEYVIDTMTIHDDSKENKSAFCNDFCDDINNTDFYKFDYQKEILLEVLRKDIRFLLDNSSSEQAGMKFEQDSILLQSLVEAGRMSQNTKSNLFVLGILQDSYNLIYHDIENAGIDIDLKALNKFRIINAENFYQFVRDVLYSLRTVEIERSVYISEIIRKMLVIDSISAEQNSALSIAGDILESIAYYLRNAAEKGEQINNDYWMEIFRLLIYPYDKVADRYVDDFGRYEMEICLKYMYALISCEMYDAIRTPVCDLYLRCCDNKIKYCSCFSLALHAFLYYICNEDSSFIGEERKNKCRKELLETEDYQTSLVNALSSVTSEAMDFILNKKRIMAFMRKYDARLRVNGAHILVMGDLICDYCLFMRLYIVKYYKFNNSFDVDVNEVYSYFVDKKAEEDTKKRLSRFVYFMNRSNDNNVVVESMFEELHNYVTVKYKEQEVTKSKNEQRLFLNKDKNQMEAEMEQQLSQFVYERLKPLITNNKAENEFVSECKLFSLQTYTEFVNKNSLKRYREDIAGQVYRQFISCLIDNGVMEAISRDDNYKDDYEYFTEIENNDYNLFVGSEYLYRNRDWQLSRKFKDLTKDAVFIPIYNTSFASVTKQGFAHFRILELKVDMEPVGLEHLAIETSQGYQYAPIGDLRINFEKDELSEYLNNRMKRIIVTVKMAVKFHTDCCGLVFYKKQTLPFFKTKNIDDVSSLKRR